MLKLNRIVPNDKNELIRTSSDNREYMQIELQKPSKANVLSTAKPRYRNVFGAGGTVNAKADTLFTQIKQNLDKADENGNFKQNLLVEANIEQIEIEPFYIPNEYGKHTDPQTGEKANKVTFFTDVVFEDENIESLARANKMTPKQSEAPAEEEAVETVTDQELEMSITR